eukprot:4530568-Pyramimonas_sp.AAC.1
MQSAGSPRLCYPGDPAPEPGQIVSPSPAPPMAPREYARFTDDGICQLTVPIEVGGVRLHGSHSLHEWARYGLKLCAACGVHATVDGPSVSRTCSMPR